MDQDQGRKTMGDAADEGDRRRQASDDSEISTNFGEDSGAIEVERDPHTLGVPRGEPDDL